MTFVKRIVLRIYFFLIPPKSKSKKPPLITPREITPLDLRFESVD
jgi:hypothetical protein